MTLDQETAEQLRKEAADKKGSSKSGGKARGPVDSGKGVRIQVTNHSWGCVPGAETAPNSCRAPRPAIGLLAGLTKWLLTPCRVDASTTQHTA